MPPNSRLDQFTENSQLFGPNAPYVEQLYEVFLTDPLQISSFWRSYFQSFGGDSSLEYSHAQALDRIGALSRAGGRTAVTDGTVVAESKQAAVVRLINAYRVRGHKKSTLDPLALISRPKVPDLEYGFHGLVATDLNAEFDTGSLFAADRMHLSTIIALLDAIYCGDVGYEYMHITDTAQKRWLQERIEPAGGLFNFDKATKEGLPQQLTAAEGLERYLHTKYVGQKRFSLEGSDALIPLLHDLIQHSGIAGTREIVIGMAHRGRLNVLVNILGKAPQQLFDEFEGRAKSDDPERSGDVKYHMGFSSNVRTPGSVVHLALAFNPSHLEIVNPVVAGSVLARQTRRGDVNHKKVFPILIHGDAAFAGQGVVMELFNMSQVPDFKVGGTYHIIVNNQIGFTTSNPIDTGPTRYTTEVAKMVQAPIFHVNGENPEAVRFVTEVAAEFRNTFHKDVVVDLVSYRRHGHNEADEPAATQPVMYRHIRSRKTPRRLYADKLIADNLIDENRAQQMVTSYRDALDAGHPVREVEEGPFLSKHSVDWHPYLNASWDQEVETGLSAARITSLCERLHTLPSDLELHPRVAGIIDNRRQMAIGKMPMDWGFAEILSYASLLEDNFSIRLDGQDSGRGTFFHRHAVLHNQSDGESYIPLQELVQEGRDLTIIDSVLSEEAVLAFEYGYASADPDSLVIWEAQFGDFANGAQVVIDQFISSGEAKWGRLCGLTLLLPHGFEGQGPEHSSARLERYMQLCAQSNMQVCMPTTPAQIFHLLRRQMLRPFRKPLVVMTPKSLLRHKSAVSTLDELVSGNFEIVIGDQECAPDQVERLVLCSGKVYFDLAEERHKRKLENVALVRVEQLYPFPKEIIQEGVMRYPKLKELVWCQEEPRNQGSWYQIKHHLQLCKPTGATLFFAGRRRSSSPAVGQFAVHLEQQKKLVDDAISLGKSTFVEVE